LQVKFNNVSDKFSPNAPRPGLQTLNIVDGEDENTRNGTKAPSFARKKINFNLHLHKTQYGPRKGQEKLKNKTLDYCFQSSDQRKGGEKRVFGPKFWIAK